MNNEQTAQAEATNFVALPSGLQGYIKLMGTYAPGSGPFPGFDKNYVCELGTFKARTKQQAIATYRAKRAEVARIAEIEKVGYDASQAG